MIARIWHGTTDAAKQQEYWEYTQRTGIADYQSVAGNKGVFALSRIEGDVAHFLYLTLWEDEDAIRAFTGEALERAQYYPEDADYLLEMEPTVTHYEVLVQEEETRLKWTRWQPFEVI